MGLLGTAPVQHCHQQCCMAIIGMFEMGFGEHEVHSQLYVDMFSLIFLSCF